MGVDRIAYIKERYSVLEYARDVLGLPVRKSGDRCTSIAPGPHKTNNAFVVYEDWWYDFSQGCGGDVIDLCAEAKHGGDKGEAIRELAGNYGLSENWKSYTENLCDKIAYFHSKLRDVDREYLSQRGIKADTIERLKLGYDEKEDRLIVPYFKNGYVAYYIGRDRSGNPDASKYKKAKLDGLNENIAWGLHSFSPERRKEVREKVKDETKQAILEKYTVVAEGAFDVMSFEQDGFKVLSPISGYFNKETLKQVISLCKTQECVFICFDSDKAGTKFQINMAQQLFKHRVKFVCGTLPEGYKDISEYYEAGGDLFELVGKAKSGIAVLARQINDKDEFKKFVYQSARFVDEPDLVELFENVTQFSKPWLTALLKKALRPPTEKTIIQEIMAQRNLKYAEERGFFEYSHGVWKERSDNIIKSYIAERLGQYARGSNLSTILSYLKAETTTEELFNRQPIFNFTNCVLDLKTGEKKEHSPTYMSTVQVSYNYDEQADCLLWKKFVSEVMAGRETSIKLLQEMAGYVLYEDNSLQKCFFLMGDGANGKSVLLNTLCAVFGEANVSNVEMSGLIEPFQCISLINSLVNVSTETSSNVKGAESVFKKVVAGDIISGCYKNKDFVNFRPRCKMISACNEYIKSRDTTPGFMRRMCFIDFPCKFEGEKADTELENKLKAELPGIFNWAYEGYKRLREQKKFTETPEQKEMMEEFKQITNPIEAFVQECLIGKFAEIERGQLYQDYVVWCRSAGHESQSRTKFIRNFKTTMKGRNVSEKTIHGTRYFVFDNEEDFVPRPLSDFYDEEDS